MRDGAATVWSVRGLLLASADALQARLGAASVHGELSAFTRAASGHCYFTLKDDEGAPAALRCAMFRRAASLLAFAPREGLRVQLRGRVAVYEPRGELQFVVESMVLAGEGALYERFLALKTKLEAQGWFSAERKRELPRAVRCVGVVTSLAAAALHDVATTLARRAPHVPVVVYPALVQGAEAPAAIVDALATAARRQEVDVLLLVRGGGSLEDLWAFNDERVVRAVASSPLPVVVGVGHESDVTLADLAADLRAPTPTAAAELAVPSRARLAGELEALRERLVRALARRLEQHALRLDRAALHAGKPARWLERHRLRLERLASRTSPRLLALPLQAARHWLATWQARASTAVHRRVDGADHALARWQARLDAIDPARVLQRGYAWLTDDAGRPIVSVDALQRDDRIRAVLADGRVQARVEVVERDDASNTTAPRPDPLR